MRTDEDLVETVFGIERYHRGLRTTLGHFALCIAGCNGRSGASSPVETFP